MHYSSLKTFKNFHINRESLLEHIFEENKNVEGEPKNMNNEIQVENKQTDVDGKVQSFNTKKHISVNSSTRSGIDINKAKCKNQDMCFRASTYSSRENNYASLNKQNNVSEPGDEFKAREHIQASSSNSIHPKVEDIDELLFDLKNDKFDVVSSSKQNENILETITGILGCKKYIYAPPSSSKNAQQFGLSCQSSQIKVENLSTKLSDCKINQELNTVAEGIDYEDFTKILGENSKNNQCNPIPQNNKECSSNYFQSGTETMYNYSLIENPSKNKKRKSKIASNDEMNYFKFSHTSQPINNGIEFKVPMTRSERKPKIAANFSTTSDHKISGQDNIENETSNSFLSESKNSESVYSAQRRLMAAIEKSSHISKTAAVDEPRSCDPAFIARRKLMDAIEKRCK